MSSSSRTQNSTTAVEYVLEVILNEPSPANRYQWGPFRNAFEHLGINTIEDFVILRPADFFDMEIKIYTVIPADDAEDVPESYDITARPPTVIEARTLESLQLLYQD